MHEPEDEGAASDSDELSGEEPSQWEVGYLRGKSAGESTRSLDPELDGETNDINIDPFEDMLDYAPMDDQVRSL